MNDYQYEFITTLQYRVKNLQAQVDAFKNGSKYRQMDAQYKSLLYTEECRIHKLECPTLCDPMNRSTPGLPVHHQLPGLGQTHVHRVSDAIQASHPLSPPSPALNLSQHQCLFQ